MLVLSNHRKSHNKDQLNIAKLHAHRKFFVSNTFSPERLRGVFTTRRYTNPRLPIPLLLPFPKFFLSLS